MTPYQIDIKFIDTTEWQELFWYNSGGTRAKKILQDPSGKEYFFKCSEKKPARDGKPEKYYKYEFWNEIIAYQLGKNLGLDVLRYDVAVFDGEIGCLSPKMTVTDEEQLIEVGRFMTAINPDFLPENNKTRSEYTFQLLTKTLDYFNLNQYLPFFFETILFDAIIGNTDRHQENWAFIGKTTFISRSFKKRPRLTNLSYPDFIKSEVSKTAPIYDNGSSLARELTNDRVDFLLNNEDELIRYIENGKSELHWNNTKLSHFDLVERLLNTSYRTMVLEAGKFLNKWQVDLASAILTEIDAQAMGNLADSKIPANRKALILELLSLRFKKLSHLVRDGI